MISPSALKLRTPFTAIFPLGSINSYRHLPPGRAAISQSAPLGGGYPPEHQLSRIGQRLKDPLRRSGDVDFRDHGILVGRNLGSRHHRHSFPPLEDGRIRPSFPAIWNLLLAPQVKDFFLFLAVIVVNPLFGVVVWVRHRDDQAIHVTGVRSGKIRNVEKSEVKGLAVR